MPRYHFNVTDGYNVAGDVEGSELGDIEAARTEACGSARQLMAKGDAKGLCRRHWRIDVTTEAGDAVFSFPFAHALDADKLVASDVRQRD